MIITCNLEEVVQIGDDIKLKILEVRGRQVCLGITAPKSTSIYREEIYQRVQASSDSESN